MINVNIPIFFKRYLNYVLPFFIIDVSFEKSCSVKCIERNGKSFGYPCHSLLGIPSELFAKIMLIYNQSFCCYVMKATQWKLIAFAEDLFSSLKVLLI